MIRFEATIDADNTARVTVRKGVSKEFTPTITENTTDEAVLHLVDACINRLTADHSPHWYVRAFALKTVVGWLLVERARGLRIDVDVRRVFTLEIG